MAVEQAGAPSLEPSFIHQKCNLFSPSQDKMPPPPQWGHRKPGAVAEPKAFGKK